MKFYKKQNLKVVASFILLLAIGIFMGSGTARALSNIGPDTADFSNPDGATQFGYIVTGSQNTDVQITHTQVKLYFKNNTGTKTITIDDANLCTDPRGSAPSSGGNYRDVAYGTDWSLGDPATDYYIVAGTYNTSATPVKGYYSSSNTCYSTTKSLSFAGSNLVYDSKIGYYVGTFNAVSLTLHGQNIFDLKLSDADAIVGYSSGQSATSFGLARETPSSGYRNYYLRFGPDCTVTQNTTAHGYWYDDDNGDPSIQPNPMTNQLRKYQYDGTYVSTVPMTFTNATTVKDVSTSTDPTNTGSNLYEVYSGSKKKVTMNFTVEPGYKYVWRWNNVYYVNILQFQLPFDSIYYETGCQAPASTIQPSSTVDKPSVSYPDTATFNHYANVSSFQRNGTINYSVQRTKDGVAQGSPQTGSYNFTGNGQFNLKTNTYSPAASDIGSTICETLTITDPAPNTQSLNITGNPSQACTKVVAHPYVTVTGNDVWAGSNFDYSNNECSGAAARNSNISSWVNSGTGAFGQYGVLALGTVSGFGSANTPGVTGLTFANTPTLGGLGASLRCMPDYAGQVGAGGSAWTGIGTIPSNAGKQKYYSNGSVTISGGTVPAGTQAVLVVNGDVTITNNINYANSYSSQSSISNLWIIAKGNINIQENVTSLDGFYVAEGTSASPGILQTCIKTGTSTTYNPITTQNCGNALDVYGSLMADKIYWQRTRGTAATGQPYAESVKFAPELYLTSPFSSGTVGQVTTQDTKELPPVW